MKLCFMDFQFMIKNYNFLEILLIFNFNKKLNYFYYNLNYSNFNLNYSNFNLNYSYL